jgi:hypothetical protein
LEKGRLKKLNCYLTIILSAAVLLILSFNLAQAQWSEINSGYAVTTNWHGKEVPIGQSVTAWAGTTNSSVYQVEFKWKNETGYVVHDVNVTKANMVNYTTPDYPPDAPQEIIDWAKNRRNADITIFYATNTQIPNSTGNWSVQVFFYAPGGHLIGQGTDIVAIRATSFNVIPDIPVLGSAGALTAMLLSLGLFLYRKRASTKTTTF